ncbi:hypothetical protein JMM63_21085 [Rhodovulum sulfidophilum]|uniref:Uncharacterized protein n=2 Tax=Rhodovulum sulfidophilum TaxID=35806 RepID=A0ABS1RNU2_RHOSU|nr:hypothetical protein [Rhodovulum sulfidophilum]MBK5924212.1 hypothetical protein [Rhodovulum sulfidophilum]MBL3551733.1 hypothetical protein [Rhodovulum sulfidophilum]MBL3561927.1 hypothetical protein [Rhodovulum sulfidophilum]MBL3572694.1 hypothetical protein [Rhodovulum sulfidophilum]MBL3598009.1 hypothetical protein [Rhodovulum sulfidophilum]
MKYIWDDWMPKLSSKQRLLTDVAVEGEGTTTPFSDALGFKCLSENSTSKTELMTDNPTPLSRQMNWPLLGGMGEGHVELQTSNPTPLSSRMGWPLLSKRAYYGVAAK